MNQKGFALPILLVILLLALLVGIGWFIWQQGQISTNPPSAPTEAGEQSIKVPPTCEFEDISVDVETYSTLPTRIVTVSIKGLDGKEIRNLEIENVPSNEFHYYDIGKCYLYIKKETESNTELWRYNFDLKGEKIYESKGFDFNISTSEKILAIDNDLKVLVIVIDSGEQINEITIDSLKKPLVNTQPAILEVLGIDLRGWNEEESELWGSLSAAAYVYGFWKLDVNSGNTEVFSELYNPTPNGVLLNPDKEVYAVSDKPLFFDVEGYEDWKNETENYSIYIYSLRDKTSTLIDTLPSAWSPGMLSPLRDWDSPTELRYSTPDGEQVYNLNN